MSILDSFIITYKEKFTKEIPTFDESLIGLIQKTGYTLLDEKMSASKELEQKLAFLHVRAKEPMKVAITGQFSSGKSTFLNALLSKNILPTGITPVTSKVNYIKYGDELKIKIRYVDGREEYQSVEHIAKFTDQRGEVEEIEYLTLYVPLELLKTIEFVDTPGLNSQAITDTTTTQKVLKEVDGIIWLSLIDNAGKLSEAKVLEEYLNEYQNKSLCVLNQKDKFSPEQVEQTTQYVKKSFAEFFSEVIPISAKQALESRSHDKNVLIEEELEEFLRLLGKEIKEHSLNDIQEPFNQYKTKIESILGSDLNKNIALLKDSNIELVLEFINKEIRPIANSSKDFVIKKDIRFICDSLINQHELFLKIYDELSKELSNFEEEADKKFGELKVKFTKKLKDAYSKIEEIIDTIANDIYNHIDTTSRVRYAKQKTGLLNKKIVYEAIEYKTAKIDSDLIYKHLFYDDDIVGKMFKKYVKNLKEIQDEVNENNALVYEILKKKIRKWQSPYEFIRKTEALHSDIEFANIRKFASKAYENILKPFSDEIHSSYAGISSQFNHLSSAVSFNYQNAAEVSVAFLEKKISQSVKLYEENPTKFSLYQPKIEEIKERLKISFHLYELQNMMNTNNTFLNKDYDKLIKEFKNISEDRKEFIEKRKARHNNTIEILKSHIISIF
ncbi:dynamin family protein [Sulfurospirillum arcachonense]|uniref:dynamin family protein n=1 Tax=Sulfurospirillum arcachonense TaxID=57666 RepID=UPI00046AC096|nr:dynamin family protein [Sulfurospirillum arcachonense]